MNTLKILFLGCLSILSMSVRGQCNTDYQLYWSDEFDLSAVDTDKWVPQQGGGGFGNQEIQYYKPENASVSGGLLHIKMAKDTVVDGATTYYYTSAKLQTATKVNFQYGRMEASIRMPDAVGSWPAFWMLGSNIDAVGWPHCGEIDIMEWVGRGPNAATGSIFYDGTWPDNHLSTPYNIPSGQSFITDFHTFAIEWEPNEIRYYCDGNHYATYTPNSISPKEWVFNHEFYIILNCAVGGTGGGSVISFNNPQYMDIDYVRVYALPSTADSIVLSGPKALMENSQNASYTTKYFPNTTYTWSLPAGATLVDGDGTNSIHVNYTTGGGKLKVTAANACGTLSDSMMISLVPDECKIMYDNEEDSVQLSYMATGTMTQYVSNPYVTGINLSPDVAEYQRNLNETYDVLGVNDIALEDAALYESGSRVFYMDVYTAAPVGTQITLQLENSALNAGPYPQGRRSAYIAKTSKQNEWHTLQFKFSSIISSATASNQVDHIALLFDPGHLTDDIYYLDNFKRLKVDPSCDPLPTAITDPQEQQTFMIYPNPVRDKMYVNGMATDQAFVIYNAWGEEVVSGIGNRTDVSALPQGIYIFKSGNKVMRFVKQ